MQALGAGQRIGAYAVEGRVGEGGMGAVYRARDTSLGRVVALKVIRATADEGPAADMIARFLREARLGASLSHPNIVVVYEAGAFGDVPYLAMEWVEGRPLAALIDDPELAMAQRIEILDAMADALAYAHAHGVIHRDVKPNNVMVDTRGRARLVDFGIAKRTANFSPGTMMLPTHAKQVLGTPAYMAPEQMLSASVDARADQFSWGVMAYELLSTKHPNETVAEEGPPFPVAKASPLVWLRPEVPEAIASIVHRAMSYEPSTRFGSMDEVLAAWRAAKSGASPVTGSGAYGAPPTQGSHSPSHAATPYQAGQAYGQHGPHARAHTPGSIGGSDTTRGGSTSPAYMPPTVPMGMPQNAMVTIPHAHAHAYGPAPARSFPWLALIGAVGALVLVGMVGTFLAVTLRGPAVTTPGTLPIPGAGAGPIALGGPKSAVLESFDDLKFAPPTPDLGKTKAIVEAKVTPCLDASVSKEHSFKAEVTVAADGRITKIIEQNVCKEISPSHYICTERGVTPKKNFPTVPDAVFGCIERGLLATRLPKIVLPAGETTDNVGFFFQVRR